MPTTNGLDDRSPLARVRRYLARIELREEPLRVTGRRVYVEVVRRAAPRRLERLHRARLRGTRYQFTAPVTDSVGRSMFLYGVYEPLSSMVFASLLGDGDTAIDVGAQYGDYALLASARVGPHGVVHAFEPQESVRAVLEENVRMNGLTHVHLHGHAVADFEGEADLDLMERVETGSASLVPTGTRPPARSSRVRVRRLDDVIGEIEAARVTAIKVDVEGAEAAVLRGAEELLRTARPGVMFEVNGLTVGANGYGCEAERLLRKQGYDIYGLARDRARGFVLERLAPGQDPSAHREPWLALNLLALSPGSTCEGRLRAAGHLP